MKNAPESIITDTQERRRQNLELIKAYEEQLKAL